MPKLFIHSPTGTYAPEARRRVASELAEFALQCESLPASPYMLSNVWVYFAEYGRDEVFMGGNPATRSVISAHVYALERGLDEVSRAEFIKGATQILGAHAGLEDSLLTVFIALHELPEQRWGSFGANPSLAAMRASAPDAPSL